MTKWTFGTAVCSLVAATACGNLTNSAQDVALPGLVRHYAVQARGAQPPVLAGLGGEMAFRAAGGSAPTSEVGRLAGQRAVVLDGDAYEAPAVTFASNAFSVALWVRPIAPGSKTGNAGSVNGMIVASGSGYTDGWRLAIYDWKTRQPSFDLGQEKGAVSVKAGDGLCAGRWNHVAATWDGAALRLYVNGMPSGERSCPGSLVAPKASLKLGYSGYGVGSLRMAADDLRVYDRALAAHEVAELSLSGAADAAAAARTLAALEAARRLGSPAQKAAAWAAAFEDASQPEHLRGYATEALTRLCRSGGGEHLPSRVLAKLPEQLSLDAADQQLFALCLAAALAREGSADAAVRIYDQLLTAPDNSPLEAAKIRQACAETLRQSARWQDARERYLAVAADGRLPSHIRGIAALAAAQTWERQEKLAEAEASFRSVAESTNFLPHLRLEAEACAAACSNRAAGRPARDPEATRQRLPAPPEPAVTFFVSPKGRDTNPGTQKRPFATLERARDAVRERIRQGALPPGGAAVYLRGGSYAATRTLALSALDSGSVGAPVSYRAWPGEKPVLDGGFRVRKLKRLADAAALASLPPEARGKVWVADVKAQGYEALDAQKSYGYGLGNKTVRELYQDGEPLQIARWPNEGSVKITAVLDATNHVFTCDADRLSRWAAAPELMACGYWLHLWAGCTVPVKAVDPTSGALTLKEKPGYGIAESRPFYVLNLLEELDRPGEWFLDTRTGKLYVWPLRHPWFSELVLTRLSSPFVEAKGVQDVMFQGLTFQHGQQHGLAMEGAVNTVVAGCTFRRLGGTALTALNSANLKVFGNLFHTLGHTAMHVSGGNRKNLTSGHVVIENNEARDFGRLSRTYNPALLLEGCGARVAHNWFHRAPSSAMRIEGNDHLIEYNLVDHVVQESDDQGGIDMWGNPSYRGVVIRFNRWQDIGGGEVPCGQAAIRFDDAISGMLVYGNLFERTSNGHFGGVQIHGGHNNIIDNNLFVGCRYGVSFSPWGQKRWYDYLSRAHVQKLMFTDVNISMPPYLTRYPALNDLGSKPDINSLWRNIFVGSDEPFFRKPAATDEWENRALAQAPDPAVLSARTPFRPLPVEEAGPYDDPLRARE